MSGVIFLC